MFFINRFKRQGSDGNECILKLLCETGQRKRNGEPGSMVIELLRSVFTYVFLHFAFQIYLVLWNQFYLFFHVLRLPEPVDQVGNVRHKKYDDAHASTDDCQRLYPKCKESVWNPKYM